eukprot:3813249-Alexandrium_andersonii.AAC.1
MTPDAGGHWSTLSQGATDLHAATRALHWLIRDRRTEPNPDRGHELVSVESVSAGVELPKPGGQCAHRA